MLRNITSIFFTFLGSPCHLPQLFLPSSDHKKKVGKKKEKKRKMLFLVYLFLLCLLRVCFFSELESENDFKALDCDDEAIGSIAGWDFETFKPTSLSHGWRKSAFAEVTLVKGSQEKILLTKSVNFSEKWRRISGGRRARSSTN